MEVSRSRPPVPYWANLLWFGISCWYFVVLEKPQLRSLKVVEFFYFNCSANAVEVLNAKVTGANGVHIVFAGDVDIVAYY